MNQGNDLCFFSVPLIIRSNHKWQWRLVLWLGRPQLHSPAQSCAVHIWANRIGQCAAFFFINLPCWCGWTRTTTATIAHIRLPFFCVCVCVVRLHSTQFSSANQSERNEILNDCFAGSRVSEASTTVFRFVACKLRPLPAYASAAKLINHSVAVFFTLYFRWLKFLPRCMLETF